MENWNSANKDIFYGEAGEMTGEDKKSAEVSALALHLLQAVIGYLNTLLIQIVLADPVWRGATGSPTTTGVACPPSSGPT